MHKKSSKTEGKKWDLEMPTIKFHIRIANQRTEVRLDGCPRCHGEHTKLIAIPFKHASFYNYHTVCPATREPIVLSLSRTSA